MEWLEHSWSVFARVLFNPATLLGISVGSVLCCIASVVVVAWAVRRLPVDYLLREPNGASVLGLARSARPLRNAVGLILLVLGVLMLVLPGQGVLTMVAAFAVMDFRSKHRAERWLLLRPRVFAAINHFRLRSGHLPLLRPRPIGPDADRGGSTGSRSGVA